MTGALDPKRIRQIVHDLPDMLAEVAPELPAASMRENLASDPDLRAAAEIVAVMAQTLRRVPGALRRPRTVFGGPLRSVAIAAKHCEDQVIDLMYQAALGHVMVDAEKHHEFHGTLLDNPPAAPDSEHIASVLTAIVEGFPVRDGAWRSVCHRLSGMQRGSEMALGLLDGCESIRPGLAGVGFVRIDLTEMTSGTGQLERPWRNYLAVTETPIARARGVQRLSICMLRSGRVPSAVAMHKFAANWLDDSSSWLNGIILGMLTGDEAWVSSCGDKFHGVSSLMRRAAADALAPEIERLSLYDNVDMIRKWLPSEMADRVESHS